MILLSNLGSGRGRWGGGGSGNRPPRTKQSGGGRHSAPPPSGGDGGDSGGGFKLPCGIVIAIPAVAVLSLLAAGVVR